MILKLLVVCVICDAARLSYGLKPTSKFSYDDQVEVFGGDRDEMIKKDKETAEQVVLRQEFLLKSKHDSGSDIEVFNDDKSQSEKLRSGGADTVAIIINNIKPGDRDDPAKGDTSRDGPDIPVVKGYGGLTDSEVQHYLKPSKDLPRTNLHQISSLNTRASKDIANTHSFVPYQGPNIQYSRPTIECRPVDNSYYSYGVRSDTNGFQITPDWNSPQSNFVYNQDVPRNNNNNCDCSSGSEWKPSTLSTNRPKSLYSWPSSYIKPKVHIDDKLATPFSKPSQI